MAPHAIAQHAACDRAAVRVASVLRLFSPRDTATYRVSVSGPCGACPLSARCCVGGRRARVHRVLVG